MEQGDRVADRYVLTSPIGRGGMAEVWCASDERLTRDVAVKFLAPRLADDPEFLVRFFSEAQSVARINDPAVVSVLDFGQHGGSPYLAMEYVAGGSVKDLDPGTLAAERAVEIVSMTARGAGAAHAVGLVHRDIKPANILLDEHGDAKLADFGIASNAGAERLTATGTAIGSPHYISPEQVSGLDATPASDVYSLGVVLYELLTGVRPFDGDNVTAIAIAHVDQEAEPPSSHDPTIEPWLDAVVMRCLAKDPGDRYPDGTALAEALRRGAATPVAAPPGMEVARSGRGERSFGLATVAVMALLLAVVGAALVVANGDEGTAVATPSHTFTPRPRLSPTPSASPGEAAPAQSQAPAVAPPSPSPSEPRRAKERNEDTDEAKDEPAEEPAEEQTAEPTEPDPTPTPETEPTADASPGNTDPDA